MSFQYIPSDDRLRLWKALASYINECRELADGSTEPDMVEYYQVELNESEELRRKLNPRD